MVPTVAALAAPTPFAHTNMVVDDSKNPVRRGLCRGMGISPPHTSPRIHHIYVQVYIRYCAYSHVYGHVYITSKFAPMHIVAASSSHLYHPHTSTFAFVSASMSIFISMCTSMYITRQHVYVHMRTTSMFMYIHHNIYCTMLSP